MAPRRAGRGSDVCEPQKRGSTLSLGAFLGDMTLVQASVAIRDELAARKLAVMDDDRENWNIFCER